MSRYLWAQKGLIPLTLIATILYIDSTSSGKMGVQNWVTGEKQVIDSVTIAAENNGELLITRNKYFCCSYPLDYYTAKVLYGKDSINWKSGSNQYPVKRTNRGERTSYPLQ